MARLELERRVGEFGHHAVLGEPAEVAAVARRVLREFGRDLGEILAGLDAGERRLGLFLRRQQDVAGVDLRLGRLRLGGLVIGLVLGLLGRGGFGHVGQQPLHRQLVVIIGQPAREVGGAVELVRKRLLGDQPADR